MSRVPFRPATLLLALLGAVPLLMGSDCSTGFTDPDQLLVDDDSAADDDDGTSSHGDDDTGPDDDDTADDDTGPDDDDTADDDSGPDDDDAGSDECSPVISATCGWSISADTGSASATDEIDAFPCSGWDSSGPELAYVIHATESGPMTATLSDIEAGQDLDVYVIQESGSGCAAGDCLTFGDNEATWTGNAGATYYLVVDGYQGSSGGFVLELSCGSGGDDDDDATTPPGDDDDATTAPPDDDDAGTPPPDDDDATTPPAAGACDDDWTLAEGGSDTWNNGDAGSTDAVDTWSCVPWDESGPEYTYLYTAAVDGTVTVDLELNGFWSFLHDLDVFVLDASLGCLPGSCVAYGDDQASFDVTTGSQWYIVIDGYAGDTWNYTVSLNYEPPPPPVEGSCSDGTDGDGDGAVDCADTDCASDPACAQCVNDWTLSCGGSDSWNNSGTGSTSVIGTYSCVGWDESGPEYTYIFQPSTDADVTVSLSSVSGGDVDVFVLDGGAGCYGSSCLAYGDVSAQFAATGGQTYYVVVDGYYGDTADYSISVTCN